MEQSHDLNGNLLVDGKRKYFWNANNRLVGWKSHDGQSQAWKSYDGLGRLISETMQVGEEVSKSDFVYDGWNQIQETTDQGNGQVRSENFIWGEDLSGTLQGAGGVGGLLARQSSEDGTSFYQMDGNGNVLGLADIQGNPQAKYRYDAFGNKVWEGSQLVLANQFSFSTKRENSESGLLYYGYRHYDPVTGRWPSRDPIEEEGGSNLKLFAVNNSVNNLDYLGMFTRTYAGGVESLKDGSPGYALTFTMIPPGPGAPNAPPAGSTLAAQVSTVQVHIMLSSDCQLKPLPPVYRLDVVDWRNFSQDVHRVVIGGGDDVCMVHSNTVSEIGFLSENTTLAPQVSTKITAVAALNVSVQIQKPIFLDSNYVYYNCSKECKKCVGNLDLEAWAGDTGIVLP